MPLQLDLTWPSTYLSAKLKQAFPNWRIITDARPEVVRSSDVVVVPITEAYTFTPENIGNVKIVGVYGSGVDRIELSNRSTWAKAEKTPPILLNCADVCAQAAAEHTVRLILATIGRLNDHQALARSGAWAGWSENTAPWMELRGSRVLLVGYGRIARNVHSLLAPFGCDVRVWKRGSEFRPKLGRSDYDDSVPSTLGASMRAIDIVSVHVPLTNETRGLIGARELQTVEGVYLVNTSRGPVVDTKALRAAIIDRKVLGAALDVWEEEPQAFQFTADAAVAERVILTPHVATDTVRTRKAMADDLISKIRAHAAQAFV